MSFVAKRLTAAGTTSVRCMILRSALTAPSASLRYGTRLCFSSISSSSRTSKKADLPASTTTAFSALRCSRALAQSPHVSPLHVPRATIYTNGKRSFARGTEEEKKARDEAAQKASQEFLKQPLNEDGSNAPRARDVEDLFPTLKQLNEELPSAAELEKALKEGKMDAYTEKPRNDED